MPQENVETVVAALNAFAELDEGLIDRQRIDEFFAQDGITTFSGFEGFLGGFSTSMRRPSAAGDHSPPISMPASVRLDGTSAATSSGALTM